MSRTQRNYWWKRDRDGTKVYLQKVQAISQALDRQIRQELKMRTFIDNGIHEPFKTGTYDTPFRGRGDYDPYVSLWMSVLQLAVADMDSIYDNLRRHSRKWIFSMERQMGSFRWVCDHVGLEWTVLQSACVSKANRSEIIRSQRKSSKDVQQLRAKRIERKRT